MPTLRSSLPSLANICHRSSLSYSYPPKSILYKQPGTAHLLMAFSYLKIPQSRPGTSRSKSLAASVRLAVVWCPTTYQLHFTPTDPFSGLQPGRLSRFPPAPGSLPLYFSQLNSYFPQEATPLPIQDNSLCHTYTLKITCLLFTSNLYIYNYVFIQSFTYCLPS